MQALLEPRVRCLVADTLGVGMEELGPDVSLTDDLAADSLDLAELAARLEAELGLVVPDRVVEHLRTYGDLVRAAMGAVRERRATLARSDASPVLVRAHLVSPRGQLLRAEFLTPYAAETIAADVVRAGPGARLEITVAEDASDAELAGVRAEFAWLAEHGLAVGIDRANPPDSGRSSAAA